MNAASLTAFDAKILFGRVNRNDEGAEADCSYVTADGVTTHDCVAIVTGDAYALHKDAIRRGRKLTVSITSQGGTLRIAGPAVGTVDGMIEPKPLVARLVEEGEVFVAMVDDYAPDQDESDIEYHDDDSETWLFRKLGFGEYREMPIRVPADIVVMINAEEEAEGYLHDFTAEFRREGDAYVMTGICSGKGMLRPGQPPQPWA